MSQTATAAEIVAELIKRDYKMDPSTSESGVFFDVGNGDGSFRSYAIELINGKWSINQKAVQFVNDEDEEEESEFGSFDAAVEIAETISEAEEEF